MAKYRIKLISSGIKELLKSKEITSEVYKAASDVQKRAGAGYEIGQYTANTRSVATVYAASDKAKKDNLENNTLLKSLNWGS